jgi:sporulation protein YlmC with PRC-barrel domain
MTHHTHGLLESRGATVYDRAGTKIGTVEDIYLDRQTNEPVWAAVKAGSFGDKLNLVPLVETTQEGSDLRVPYDQDQVKDAPTIDADGELSQQKETALYRHYDLDYSKYR